jgi:hypothetical protein
MQEIKYTIFYLLCVCENFDAILLRFDFLTSYGSGSTTLVVSTKS